MTCSEFIFRLPTGEEVARAQTLKDLGDSMEEVSIESLEYHNQNKHFSPWLIDHDKAKLARKFEKERNTGEKLRKKLVKAIEKQRIK
jgi:hypothetical protein